MEFCALESCGKCTPCRIGSMRGVETLDRIINGDKTEQNIALVEALSKIAGDNGVSTQALAFAWVKSRGDDVVPLIGARRRDQLKEALGAVSQAGHKSDMQAQAVVAGKSNIIDVVTAVAESEVAIDAVVTVRDKVISAYEDIMKMPI